MAGKGIPMVAPVRQIAEWLGAKPRNEFDLARIVRKGLPLTIQAESLSHGMTKEEFHMILIPHRTFRHRTERLNRGLPEVLTPIYWAQEA
jgi:hypothetical protein